MTRWERIVDQLVGDIIGDGDVSHLPGAGKPLDLKDDVNTPSESRTAFKIMRDHDVMPEWIEAGKALDEREERLKGQLKIGARKYVRELKLSRDSGLVSRTMQMEKNWKQFKEKFCERVGRYNREALLYNLKLPAGLPHKRILSSEAMIKHTLAAVEEES